MKHNDDGLTSSHKVHQLRMFELLPHTKLLVECLLSFPAYFNLGEKNLNNTGRIGEKCRTKYWLGFSYWHRYKALSSFWIFALLLESSTYLLPEIEILPLLIGTRNCGIPRKITVPTCTIQGQAWIHTIIFQQLTSYFCFCLRVWKARQEIHRNQRIFRKFYSMFTDIGEQCHPCYS